MGAEERSGVKSNKATKKSSKSKEKKEKAAAPPPPAKEKKKKKDKLTQQVEEPPAGDLESLMCFDEPAAANKSDQLSNELLSEISSAAQLDDLLSPASAAQHVPATAKQLEDLFANDQPTAAPTAAPSTTGGSGGLNMSNFFDAEGSSDSDSSDCDEASQPATAGQQNELSMMPSQQEQRSNIMSMFNKGMTLSSTTSARRYQ